jgi:hypothetical protein
MSDSKVEKRPPTEQQHDMITSGPKTTEQVRGFLHRFSRIRNK